MKTLRTLLALAALGALLAPVLHAQDALIQPAAITSSTSATDFFPVGNLIDGSGLSGTPTLAALGTHSPIDSTTAWVTAVNGTNYFNAGPAPVLICTLPQQARVSELVIWGYGGNANEAKSFEVAFSTDGSNFAYGDFVTQPTLLATGAVRLVFPGGPREATHVRLRITANHFFTVPTTPGGDRVGLGEIRFVGQPSQVIVSNLGNARTGDDFLDNTPKVAAHAFTTGPASLVLSSITLRVRDAGGGVPQVRVKLCADTGTAPGTVLADLGLLSVTNTSITGNVTWNPAPGTAPTLTPGTRYWITAQNTVATTAAYWAVSSSTAFTGSGTLPTTRAVSTDGGASWTDATNGNTHLLQVTGVSPFLVTNTNDSGPGSLRQAMANADAFTGADTVTFDSALSGQTITLSTFTNPDSLGNTALVVGSSVTVDTSALPGGITLTRPAGAAGDGYRAFRILSGGSLTLRGLTVSGFTAQASTQSGAILSSGSLTLERCTLTGNSTEFNGGAIYNLNGTLAMTHCTLAGNSSTSYYGGAIFNFGTATLKHCTLAGNSAAGAGGGIYNYDSTSTVTLTNCIVASNTGSGGGPDIYRAAGTITSTGVNLIGNLADSSLSAGATVLTGPANLAPLAANGGPTQTRPPLGNSPAIDAAVAVGGLSTDQRGLPYASGPAPDIGAVELQEIRVNTLADQNDGTGVNQVSLREALTSTAPGVAEVVRFAPAVFNAVLPATNTIALTTASGGQITVTKSVLVDASDIPAGVTLDGGAQNFRLILMQSGSNLALRDLTLANGRAPGDSGGAIFNDFGTLTLTRCTLFGNSAEYGGAIYTFTAGITGSITSSITLTHCTLSGNTATVQGGAIYNENGRTTLIHCTVSGNTAPAGAGSGVASWGDSDTETVVQNSIIAGNVNSDVNLVGSTAPNSFKSQGYNLIGSGNATNFNQTGDLINVAPLLAPLGSYGGGTQTRPPLANSPAIDAASAVAGLPTDQRGLPRASGPAPDIGAVELQEIRVNTLADENNGIGNGSSVSLREALTSTAPGVAEVVRFAPAVFNGTPVGKNTIPLGSEIVVAKSVLVDAGDIPAGVTLDGGAQNFRLIYVDGASGGSNLALRGLTLANGRAPGDFGGAIFNYFGTLTLTRCTLFGNSADSGGAIFSRTASITAPITSSTSLTHCTLSGNTATAFFDGAGGAIWNGNGRTTLLHCTVSGNTAPMGAGSGVASLATANTETLVQNSVIAGNVNSDVDFVFNATNSFTSQGYNRIGSGNATGDFNQPGDLINVAPLLAPLGDYGGPTRTMLPLPGSPAIDAALTSTATADQRGIPRPQGAARDIGAVETFTLSAPAFLDNDSDGMDDRLEPLYGFTVGVADGALDTDGDGSSNAAELGNKTSPRDSTSLLRIVAFTPAGFALDGDPLFDVTWTSFPGLTYTLQAKADLNFAVAPRDAPDVTATAFTHTLRIELDKNNPKDFIRVRRNVIP